MFVRRLSIERIATDGSSTPCPIRWIDSFAMRNFTNDAVFDDTLPVSDGVLEAGLRVPLALLQQRMEDWFHRKGYLAKGETLHAQELTAQEKTSCRHEESSLHEQARGPR